MLWIQSKSGGSICGKKSQAIRVLLSPLSTLWVTLNSKQLGVLNYCEKISWTRAGKYAHQSVNMGAKYTCESLAKVSNDFSEALKTQCSMVVFVSVYQRLWNWVQYSFHSVLGCDCHSVVTSSCYHLWANPVYRFSQGSVLMDLMLETEDLFNFEGKSGQTAPFSW